MCLYRVQIVHVSRGWLNAHDTHVEKRAEQIETGKGMSCATPFDIMTSWSCSGGSFFRMAQWRSFPCPNSIYREAALTFDNHMCGAQHVAK